MATVIDELVVLLGLDASKFSEEQKKVAGEYVRLRENAARSTKEAQGHTDNLTRSFTALQGRLLGIAALFLGGMGIKQFAEQVAQLTNQLGRAGQQAGITAGEMYAYGGVGRALGVNPQGLRSAVSGIAAAGNSPTYNPQFWQAAASMGISPGKLPNGDLDVNRLMVDMSKFVDRERARGVGDAQITQRLNLMPGMNADMVTALLQGSDKMVAALAEMKRFGPTPEDVKAIEAVNKAWATLQGHFEKLAMTIETKLAPIIITVIDKISQFFDIFDKFNKDPVKAEKDLEDDLHKKFGTPTEQGIDGGSFWGRVGKWWHSVDRPGGGKTGGAIPGPSSKIEGGFNGKKAEVASDIVSQFKAAGVDDKGAAAILANVARESGFNPNNRHADQPKFSGEAHYAHGLYQEGGTEWNNYDAWLKKNYPGRAWQDPRLQTQFLIENLKKNYPKVWAALQNPNLSAGQKAMIFQSGYLRPAQLHGGDMHVAEGFLRNMPKATPDVWNRTTNTTTSSAETHVHGGVHVYTDKNSAYDIASGIHGALIDSANTVGQADTGHW